MSAAPARCVGAVIAGGAARRFGGASMGLLPVGGVRMFDRVAAALSLASDELLLVANAADAPGWLPGVRTVSDVRTAAGALGGIHAALVHAGAPVLAVAWDMPGVTSGLLRALRAAGEAGDADAVLPASDGPLGVEPLCAWYAPSCLPAIERRLDAGDRRAGAWLADVRTTVIPLVAVTRFGPVERQFANVNTPDDLRALDRIIGFGAADAGASDAAEASA